MPKKKSRKTWNCPRCRAGFRNGYGLICECNQCDDDRNHGTSGTVCIRAHCLQCDWIGSMWQPPQRKAKRR